MPFFFCCFFFEHHPTLIIIVIVLSSSSFSQLEKKLTEAVVRGHKAGLLRQNDYHNLFQCETLEDLKLNLVSESKKRSFFFSTIDVFFSTSTLTSRPRLSFLFSSHPTPPPPPLSGQRLRRPDPGPPRREGDRQTRRRLGRDAVRGLGQAREIPRLLRHRPHDRQRRAGGVRVAEGQGRAGAARQVPPAREVRRARRARGRELDAGALSVGAGGHSPGALLRGGAHCRLVVDEREGERERERMKPEREACFLLLLLKRKGKNSLEKNPKKKKT